MSKSSKKLGKLNLLESEQRTYSHSSEGALDPNYYVNAQMKYTKTFHLAKIMNCRIIKDWPANRKKTDSAYEYYVHYVDYNRRLDEWVPRSRIELTRRLIEEDAPTRKKQKTKKEEVKADNNIDDEHEGMLCQIFYVKLPLI